ncbi:DUF2905 domain-containing protein [Legionella jordanis]|uniref:DUF2905 domain-containing protein n=1 Tax=Legionella jordanis TaxID=456 RepID=A0A0W0VHF3_9GAMM|nr:DUF2905 domain-containing protein [Legionella jordanis]KTD19238.1 hypothetical protein Ljor_0035 [Legionella jordanis]RMW99826.1 DUF2905 domain-containing protein [Legionella jordanis]RMX15120.1 DUF2905 domain-containing protein [Legionella jordanis]VEH12876.1 Protein of uncharacterised function (DUF2905) [Legionella jordanis]HAT8714870.1 DUF2905 family protein [Legionella jordanis]
MQKLLLILGIILILMAALWPLLKKFPLGRLPGDIVIQKGNFTFYFPITTCIILSLVVMLIIWFINR